MQCPETLKIVQEPIIGITLTSIVVGDITVQEEVKLLGLSEDVIAISVDEPIAYIDRLSGVVGVPIPVTTKELFDSNTPPATPPDTYLRFERDLDGDVQRIFLGTLT